MDSTIYVERQMTQNRQHNIEEKQSQQTDSTQLQDTP